MEEMRNAYIVYVRNPEGDRPLGRPGNRWEDHMKWILKKQGVMVWNGFIWLRIETSGGFM
jgi:hypothetical protein